MVGRFQNPPGILDHVHLTEKLKCELDRFFFWGGVKGEEGGKRLAEIFPLILGFFSVTCCLSVCVGAHVCVRSRNFSLMHRSNFSCKLSPPPSLLFLLMQEAVQALARCL